MARQSLESRRGRRLRLRLDDHGAPAFSSLPRRRKQRGGEFSLPVFVGEFSRRSEFLECLGEKVEVLSHAVAQGPNLQEIEGTLPGGNLGKMGLRQAHVREQRAEHVKFGLREVEKFRAECHRERHRTWHFTRQVGMRLHRPHW